jgi:hypothetical protein
MLPKYRHAQKSAFSLPAPAFVTCRMTDLASLWHLAYGRGRVSTDVFNVVPAILM